MLNSIKHNHLEIDKIKTNKKGNYRIWYCDKCNKIIIKGKDTNKYHNKKEKRYNKYKFYKSIGKLKLSILDSLFKKYNISFDKNNIAKFKEKEEKDEKTKNNMP